MRATLDLIEKAESSDHYRRVTEIFSDLRRTNGFMTLHDPAEPDRPRRLALLAYLNHYETIALFIRRDVLDEETYAAWIQGTLVNDWNSASEFIQRQRWDWNEARSKWVYDLSIYSQFQWLASRWNSNAVPLTETFSGRPTGDPTPQDGPLPEVPITSDLSPPTDIGPDSVDKPNP